MKINEFEEPDRFKDIPGSSSKWEKVGPDMIGKIASFVPQDMCEIAKSCKLGWEGVKRARNDLWRKLRQIPYIKEMDTSEAFKNRSVKEKLNILYRITRDDDIKYESWEYLAGRAKNVSFDDLIRFLFENNDSLKLCSYERNLLDSNIVRTGTLRAILRHDFEFTDAIFQKLDSPVKLYPYPEADKALTESLGNRKAFDYLMSKFNGADFSKTLIYAADQEDLYYLLEILKRGKFNKEFVRIISIKNEYDNPGTVSLRTDGLHAALICATARKRRSNLAVLLEQPIPLVALNQAKVIAMREEDNDCLRLINEAIRIQHGEKAESSPPDWVEEQVKYLPLQFENFWNIGDGAENAQAPVQAAQFAAVAAPVPVPVPALPRWDLSTKVLMLGLLLALGSAIAERDPMWLAASAKITEVFGLVVQLFV